MNVDELIREAKKLDSWYRAKIDGSIHRGYGGDCQCPITAVTRSKLQKKYHELDWEEAAKELDMDPKVALSISNAADNNLTTKDEHDLRKRLERELLK